jgi:vacuolar-type H+-ATPase subunit E/Vma4
MDGQKRIVLNQEKEYIDTFLEQLEEVVWNILKLLY